MTEQLRNLTLQVLPAFSITRETVTNLLHLLQRPTRKQELAQQAIDRIRAQALRDNRHPHNPTHL